MYWVLIVWVTGISSVTSQQVYFSSAAKCEAAAAKINDKSWVAGAMCIEDVMVPHG